MRKQIKPRTFHFQPGVAWAERESELTEWLLADFDGLWFGIDFRAFWERITVVLDMA